MGTSKGYIAPTTLHWSKAKRAVTSFINNRDYDSKAKAASKYATAMKTDIPRLFRLSTHPEVPEATGNALSCSG